MVLNSTKFVLGKPDRAMPSLSDYGNSGSLSKRLQKVQREINQIHSGAHKIGIKRNKYKVNSRVWEWGKSKHYFNSFLNKIQD